MASAEPNMRVLRRSRKKPQPGDVFAMLFPDERYLFGRVVLADPERAPMPASYLVYVYRARSTGKEPDPAWASPDQLLVPPIFINQMPWTKGYFETVAHWPLRPDDLLAEHCFYDTLTEGYVDLTGKRRPDRVEPCGIWALASYLVFDDRVSDALGIPRAPEEDALEEHAQPRSGEAAAGPARQDASDEPDEAGEHAVVVRLPSGGDEPALDELEDALAAAVEDAGVGEFDGNEVGPDGAAVYLYGADGDRLLKAVRPVLTAARLPSGSWVMVRYGEPGARECRINLS